MTSELKESTRKNTTLDLVLKQKSDILSFLSFPNRNIYGDHATVGFRYCTEGLFCNTFKEKQILKQDKKILSTLTKAEEQITDNEIVDPIVVQNKDGIVKLTDLRRLSDNEWLNDDLINVYLDLL